MFTSRQVQAVQEYGRTFPKLSRKIYIDPPDPVERATMPVVDTHPTRGVIYYERSCGTKTTEACHSISAALGKGCVSYVTVRRWFISFSNGEIDMKDKPRLGLCWFWDAEGMLFREVLVQGGTVTSAVCTHQLQQLAVAVREKCRKSPRSPFFMTTPAPTSLPSREKYPG